MTTRLRWIKPRWNRLFYDKTALISSIAFLSQSGWIHAPSSTRVNSLLPDHLIEHSIIISLDNCSMMIPYKLLIMGSTNNVWIILRSDQLSLHSIGHWLVSMVSYSCCVLDTVRSDGADASGIDSNWPIAKVIDAWWKLEITKTNKFSQYFRKLKVNLVCIYKWKIRFITYEGFCIFLGDNVWPCICILYAWLFPPECPYGPLFPYYAPLLKTRLWWSLWLTDLSLWRLPPVAPALKDEFSYCLPPLFWMNYRRNLKVFPFWLTVFLLRFLFELTLLETLLFNWAWPLLKLWLKP